MTHTSRMHRKSPYTIRDTICIQRFTKCGVVRAEKNFMVSKLTIIEETVIYFRQYTLREESLERVIVGK
jgi:hypothetical protein